MGTNFFRIPTTIEIMNRSAKLVRQIDGLDIFNPKDVSKEFRIIEGDSEWSMNSPWDEFTKGMNVHLGKRSDGWRFCWNFHDCKYYSNKETLFDFIRSGRVIDEYGTIIDNEEFIKMALEWEQPNGLDNQTYYRKNPSQYYSLKHDDIYIDGLRVSSSTEFC